MISLKNVTKTFGKKTAVSKVSFSVKKGEIVGFLGPNGAGKTTTMRLIVGYLSANSGEVVVEGRNPEKERVQVAKTVGYLAENNPLYGEMKVREYLEFIAQMKESANWEKHLEVLGLVDTVESKIEELSRGYKQRVGLAAALIGDPAILILDEPTSGLDPLEQEKIRRLIRELGKSTTIILSTHILSEVEDVAGRLILIQKGIIVYDGKKPKGAGGVEKLFHHFIQS